MAPYLRRLIPDELISKLEVARKLVEFIARHAGSDENRVSFLSLPEVKKLA